MKEENIHNFSKPSVTVDMVIYTIQENDLKILLVKRGIEPFKDKWALPGGFVRINESLEDAAKRELQEETGVKDVYLEQLYSFGEPGRDPRGRVITIAYIALVNSENVVLKSTTDVSEAQWFSIKKIPLLAFDHKKILDYSLKRLKWKFEYTTVAFSMLPKKFAISQMQKIYEIVFSKKFDKRNFAKKILSLDILKEEGIKKDVSYRPPMLYSLKKNIGEIIEIL
ncbi:MAG: NUDIX domain-containing protein [Nanoarchaeota archaeon]